MIIDIVEYLFIGICFIGISFLGIAPVHNMFRTHKWAWPWSIFDYNDAESKMLGAGILLTIIPIILALICSILFK
jgi:hypothetical protein